jgi:hypothetical protein
VPLNVQSLKVQGPPEVLLANQKTNQVMVQGALPGNSQFTPVVTLADGTQSTLAPGAVQWARLDRGSPFYDAVVVASGGNALLVYRGTGFDAAGDPTFAAPVRYPVGTNPVSGTIKDVNGDGIPDMLVANQGSNDVSVLFGSWDASGDWVAQPGPRLKTGGLGPVAVTVRDVTGPVPGSPPDGIQDLVVTNGQNGTMTILPGRGQGLFDDRSPEVVNIPGNPSIEAPALAGDSGVGVIPTDDGRLFGVNLNDLTVAPQPVFAPQGAGVMAVQALSPSTLVVAQEGGGVAVLGFDATTGLYATEQTLSQLSSGVLLDPSALDVLETATGQLAQVLVTNLGSSEVFVFGAPIALQPGPGPAASGVPLPAPPTPGGTVPEATAPVGAPLVLVLTLTAGILPAGENVPTEDHLVNASGAAAAGETGVAALAAAVESGGDEQGSSASLPPGLIQDTDFGLGTDDALRQLDLAPRTDDGRMDNPMAPNAAPDRPAENPDGPPEGHSPAGRDEAERAPLSRQPLEMGLPSLLSAALDSVAEAPTAAPSLSALTAAADQTANSQASTVSEGTTPTPAGLLATDGRGMARGSEKDWDGGSAHFGFGAAAGAPPGRLQAEAAPERDDANKNTRNARFGSELAGRVREQAAEDSLVAAPRVDEERPFVLLLTAGFLAGGLAYKPRRDPDEHKDRPVPPVGGQPFQVSRLQRKGGRDLVLD